MPAGSAPWPLLLLSFLGTVVLTVFIVAVLRRSPISLITTGRNRLDWRQQNAGRSLIVGIVAIGIGVAVRLVIEPLTGNLIIATAALLVVSAVAVFWRRYRDGKGDRDVTGRRRAHEVRHRGGDGGLRVAVARRRAGQRIDDRGDLGGGRLGRARGDLRGGRGVDLACPQFGYVADRRRGRRRVSGRAAVDG